MPRGVVVNTKIACLNAVKKHLAEPKSTVRTCKPVWSLRRVKCQLWSPTGSCSDCPPPPRLSRVSIWTPDCGAFSRPVLAAPAAMVLTTLQREIHTQERQSYPVSSSKIKQLPVLTEWMLVWSSGKWPCNNRWQAFRVVSCDGENVRYNPV